MSVMDEQELDEHGPPSLQALLPHSDSDARLSRKSSLPTPTSGIDMGLFFLFFNGVITLLWGIALIVFQSGHVPISWNLSQYGQRHPGITNVIVTGIATVSTSHLRLTIKNTVHEILASALLVRQRLTLRQWAWMQDIAQVSFWLSPRPCLWPMWLLVYGLVGVHSASLVAILQPRKSRCEFTQTFSTKLSPCRTTLGKCYVQRSNALRCRCEIIDTESEPDSGAGSGQSGGTDRIAIWELLQCVPDTCSPMEPTYNQPVISDQVAANTTTALTGRCFVKDNFGYGALGGLINGLQEVPGVEIVAECVMSREVNMVPLAALWSTAFPGQVLPVPTITNGSGTFGALPESTSQQAFITSGPTFKLTGTQGALYAIVNASGGGGLLSVNATGGMAGCTWTAIPRLVHLQKLNWVSTTIGADNATTLPLPTGRAVYAAVQGMAQAVRLSGMRLDWVKSFGFGTGGSPVPAPVMLQTLLADALKGALTAYTSYATSVHDRPALTGASQCYSNNRTLSLHWHFGNEYKLGWIAIVLSVMFGLLAMCTACYLYTQERIRGVDALNVVDAFKLGGDAVDVEVKDNGQTFLRRLRRRW